MNKLTNQSPLFDITNRINEIIDNLNDNKDIYLNFKPNIENDLAKTYTNNDLPATYEVIVMGAYKIELASEKSSLDYELFIKGKSIQGTLDQNKKSIENVFMAPGDKVVFKDKTLGDNDFVKVSLQMNLLDAFIKEYEAVQNNIGIVSEISEESKREMAAIKEVIKNFYSTLEFEPVSKEELDAYLESLVV